MKKQECETVNTSLVDCDIMRSRTSCEVAEEAKENWLALPQMVAESSSDLAEEVSWENVLVTEEGIMGGLEGV